jgi:hypothetical protein
VAQAIVEEKTRIIDLDLTAYFDNVQHSLLLEKVARRVRDDAVMHLLKMILQATGKKGVPQGGVISPLLSNLYLNEVDRMLEKAVQTTRRGKSTNVQYARFADDMVILIDAERRNDWLVTAVNRRLREEFAKLHVAINEDKSRMVDLKKGESFTFLGFEYRRVLSLRRKWRPHYAPKLKKRTALFEKLGEIFRQHVSWPVESVIGKINPILRGWVNYFRVGHSSSCFAMVKQWVERKVRQHLMRARGRKGYGWKRWSSPWLYDRLGLFNDYQLRRWSGEIGDRRKGPRGIRQSRSKTRAPGLSFLAFCRRPLLSGIKQRCVAISIAGTNSAVASGLPGCVPCRRAATSSSESCSRRYCSQLERSHRSGHRPSLSKPSFAVMPQGTAALDQLHSSTASTSPAGTGWRSA